MDWLYETMAGACLALGLSRWTTDRGGSEGTEALLEKARLWAERATAKVLGNHRAAGEDRDVFEYRFAAIAEAGCLDRRDLQAATASRSLAG